MSGGGSANSSYSPTQVDTATILQVAQQAVDEVVSNFEQLMMAGDNAALVAAETHPDPKMASTVAEFLRMLVGIIQDNGEMRKRAYTYTEALQRDTIEKQRQFEASMQLAQEPTELEKMGMRLTSFFD